MPELPEVEVICRGLNQVLIGLQIRSVDVLTPKSFPGFSEAAQGVLPGCKVGKIRRRGKLILIGLQDEQDVGWCLLVHLRMTGQLVFRGIQPRLLEEDAIGSFPSQSLVGALPDKSTRVVLEFEDDARLYFNDQRKFGYMKLVPATELESESFYARLGPEPLDDDFDWRVLRSRLQPAKQPAPGSASCHSPNHSSGRSIKAALLDQEVIAGIGNIYADESLFAARINPNRPADSLSIPELKRLTLAIRERLEQSIADGGSTARNYVDSLGQRGEFLNLHAQVYGRAGLPCLRCGKMLQKTRVAGRGTVYCPNCQRPSV